LNLLKAIYLLPDKTIKLVIVGKVDHKNIDINTYIKTHGLEDRILFTGHVPAEDLYLFYARSTVFCFPSYAEGFGLPPLESMRCGVPVIVSNRTSLPEVCGDAGMYVDPNDPQDIANQIDALLSDEELYQKKRMISLQQSERFTWANATNDLLHVIGKLS
jgi:glycosyltransferase involved in cell wall biosynthesis